PGSVTEDTWFRRLATDPGFSGDCGSGSSNIIKIEINNIDPGTISGDQVTCSGDIPLELVSDVDASAKGEISYQWQVSENGNDFENINGAVGETYLPDATNAWYRRMVISTLGSNSCSDFSNIVHININNLDGGDITGDQTICGGSVPQEITSIVDGTGAGEISYAWLSSIDNLSFEIVPDAINKTYIPDAIEQETWYVRVTYSNLNGFVCSDYSDTVKISLGGSLIVEAESNSPVCAGNNILLTETGGEADSWLWSGPEGFTSNVQNPIIEGATSQNSGTYIVTGFSGGCQSNDTIEVLVGEGPVISILDIQDVLCYGDSTGSATVSVTGAEDSYNVIWNTIPQQTGLTATGLAAGEYIVTIISQSGCNAETSVVIGQPANSLNLAIEEITNVACDGPNSGAINIDITGGTEPYSYEWYKDLEMIATTEDIAGLDIGTYIVIVNDANRCSVSEEIEVIGTSGIQVRFSNISHVSCAGDNTGSARIIVTGGTEPYSYNWNLPVNQNGDRITGLATGFYTVKVTDANNCSASQNLLIAIMDLVPPQAVCQDLTIYLDENGQASVTAEDIGINSSDNCGLDTMYLNRYDFGCDDIGTSSVQLTVFDFSNHMAECTAQVEVVDTIAPVINCTENIVAEVTDGECEINVMVPLPDISDNCAIESVINDFNQTDNANGIYPVGTTTVTWTVTDIHGNVSYCSFNVVVLGAVKANTDYAYVELETVIPVLDNDFACSGIDTSTVTVTQEPEYGEVLTDTATGEISYSVLPEYFGVTFTDEFIYSVCSSENMCDTAIVYVTHEGAAFEPQPPFAINDTFNTECNSIFGNVTDNDEYIAEPFTVSELILPVHGELIINPDGSFEYIPNEGYNGTDMFTYQFCYDNYPEICSNPGVVFINVDCPCNLFVPDAFSPNNDNVHDVFYVECLETLYPEARLEVYNRWGVLVYKKEHYGNESDWGSIDAWWDGRSTNSWTLGNQKVPIGTYFYLLQLEPGNVLKGSVYVNY
ncbi:MAG: gliding motility-associated C-terminal domain-containing protein, partial [Prolixibacteraceae bacterium]|nr:gliding motility-associated C-terminal domain-containing protein [Prolixibacteraceae bacterium]